MHFVASRPIILTVDDSEENLDFISGLLEAEYTVLTAENGEEALSIARHLPRPELILLDICMPGMDGFEVCQKLKSDPETCLIPVIFLTSLNQPEDEIKGLARGAVDFITKPFKPAVVKARVRTHIELVRERQRGESLLANILPPKVIEELKISGSSTPQLYDDVSVIFSDLVNFTSLAAIMHPKILLLCSDNCRRPDRSFYFLSRQPPVAKCHGRQGKSRKRSQGKSGPPRAGPALIRNRNMGPFAGRWQNDMGRRNVPYFRYATRNL